MSSPLLTEEYIQDCFHRYLKSSLTQAKIERLVDAELLSSAEGDLMITGPALCLYFAALRCTTNPPSVPLPRSSKDAEPLELSTANCPLAFTSFLSVWGRAVPLIQGLAPDHQHDLARVICSLPPISARPDPSVDGIAAELRAVAIEISQRRSFQDRYAADLQAALDSGNAAASPSVKKASFVPPPSYEPSPESTPSASPRSSMDGQRPLTPSYATHDLPPQSPSHLSPLPSSSSSVGPRSLSPSILTPNSPAIEFIRETLYAALADCLERHGSLRRLLNRDPSRAYFASVAFAILEVATTSITTEGHVVGVLGQELTLQECPAPLRPLMTELGDIGRDAKQMDEEDTEQAMKYAQQGRDIPPARMERVKEYLESGFTQDAEASSSRGLARDERPRSLQGRALAFANRINGLSLHLTKLPAFRSRQEDVFKVLSGIGT